MFMKSSGLILFVALLIVGCGVDRGYSNASGGGSSGSGAGAGTGTMTTPDITTESEPARTDTAPTLSPEVVKEAEIAEVEPTLPYWRSWEAYEKREATKLSYWKLESEAFRSRRATEPGFLESFANALTMDTAEEHGTWTHWGYFRHAKQHKETDAEKLQRQYEAMMDAAYYFIRVPKFRAPVTASGPAYYTWYVGLAPTFASKADFTKVSKTAQVVEYGTPQYLKPGESNEGSDEIIRIPRRLVQSAMGYWNESVVIQFGVIEVSKEALDYRSSKTVPESIQRQFILSETFDFYHLKENEIVSRQAHWTGKDGEKGAAIDLQIWKGDWKSNRD